MTDYLSPLYQALTTPRGICIRTNNMSLCRAKFYEARRNAADPDLDCLSLVPSPTDSLELWIIKS